MVLAQWDGEEESVEGGDGSQEEETADIALWGCHQTEMVHRWYSGNEERRETTRSASGGLCDAVFPGPKVATTEVDRQYMREWLQNGEAEIIGVVSQAFQWKFRREGRT